VPAATSRRKWRRLGRDELAVDAPGAAADDVAALREKTERYCTVLQTLLDPPPIETATA
jgi:hypothetical protein